MKRTLLLSFAVLLVFCVSCAPTANERSIIGNPSAPVQNTTLNASADATGALNATADAADAVDAAAENSTPAEDTATLSADETAPGAAATATLPAAENLSITEEYERIFWSKANQSYEFTSEDPYYGRTFFWGHNDLLKMTNPQRYFLVDNISHLLNSSKIDIETDMEIMREDVRQRKLNYTNYAWYNITSGALGSCFVYFGNGAGTYYIRQNCEEDNTTKSDGSPTHTKIVWENLTFTHKPELPLDWLHKYDGQVPLKIQYNRTYLDEYTGAQCAVDYLFFDNHNGTITKLYIHQGLKVPVRVELLKDNKVLSYRRYFGTVVNDQDLLTFYGTFKDDT